MKWNVEIIFFEIYLKHDLYFININLSHMLQLLVFFESLLLTYLYDNYI